MNLLSQEKLIWTVPAPNWARRLLRELGTLSERQQESRQKIIAQLPLLLQYRLTLSSVTMREEADRESLLATVRQKFEQDYGIGAYQYNQWFLDVHVRGEKSRIEYDAGESMSRVQANVIYSRLRDIANWATVMVCLRLVEQRQVSMHDSNDEPAWQEIEIPADWKDFDCFVSLVPRPLFDQAAQICDDLNPGVWTTQIDPDTKNLGGVNVRG